MNFEQMNMEFRRAFRLAERGEWAESGEAYDSARVMAERLGAMEAAKQAASMRDTMEQNARGRLDFEEKSDTEDE